MDAVGEGLNQESLDVSLISEENVILIAKTSIHSIRVSTELMRSSLGTFEGFDTSSLAVQPRGSDGDEMNKNDTNLQIIEGTNPYIRRGAGGAQSLRSVQPCFVFT